jgi:hypothetical protein
MAQLPDWKARAKAHEAEIERRREAAAEIAPDRAEPIPQSTIDNRHSAIDNRHSANERPDWGPLPLKMTKEEIEAKRRRDAEAMKRWGRLVTRTRTRRVYRIDK